MQMPYQHDRIFSPASVSDPKTAVYADRFHQLFMRAPYREHAPVDHQSPPDRGQAMGDHDRRPARHQPPKRLQDGLLRLGNEGGRSPHPATEARVLQYCPGNGDSLLLAAGEPLSVRRPSPDSRPPPRPDRHRLVHIGTTWSMPAPPPRVHAPLYVRAGGNCRPVLY